MTTSEHVNSRQPLVLLDIDGVCNPQSPAPRTRPEWSWTIARCGWNKGWVSPELGELLVELGEAAELAWCTGWEHEALRYGRALGMPDCLWVPLPQAQDRRMWKLPGVEAFIADRPLLWFDDEHTNESAEWAKERSRSVSTVCYPVAAKTGLTARHIAEAASWARDL